MKLWPVCNIHLPEKCVSRMNRYFSDLKTAHDKYEQSLRYEFSLEYRNIRYNEYISHEKNLWNYLLALEDTGILGDAASFYSEISKLAPKILVLIKVDLSTLGIVFKVLTVLIQVSS